MFALRLHTRCLYRMYPVNAKCLMLSDLFQQACDSGKIMTIFYHLFSLELLVFVHELAFFILIMALKCEFDLGPTI